MVYRDCNTVQSWAYGAQSFEGCRVEDLRAYETYKGVSENRGTLI